MTTITKNTVPNIYLKAGQTEQFAVAGAAPVTWELATPNAPGRIDPATGLYTTPDPIISEQEVTVVARDANSPPNVIGQARIILSPPINIVPSAVELPPEESMKFRVQPANQAVVWSIAPDDGGPFANTQVYTAPKRIWSPRTLVVTASRAGYPAHSGSATITLSDSPFKIRVLAAFWGVTAVALIITVIALWARLSNPGKTLEVSVSPPVVTLSAAQTEQFTVSVAGATNDVPKTAIWQTDGGGTITSSGLYTAPAKIDSGRFAHVKATSVTDSKRSGSAIVILTTNRSFAVQPSSVSALPSQVVPFAVKQEPPSASNTVKWSVSPDNCGTISADGLYAAPDVIRRTQKITVAAQDAADSNIKAAATVTLMAASEASPTTAWLLVLFVFLMGALGGILHGVTSFTAYVGNKRFQTSWFWWYVFRPIIGGGMAMLVFFVVGTGYLAGASASNTIHVGAIAGLAGLFSEHFSLKLKELIEAIFPIKSDPRLHKMEGSAQSAAPRITAISPAPIQHGTNPPPTLEIAGRHFAAGCQVKINGTARTPTSVTPASLKVALNTADVAAAGPLQVVVVNPNGETSDEFKVHVT